MLLFTLLLAAMPSDCFGNATYVLRRAYDRDAKTITETRVSRDFSATVVMDVRGSSYTIRGEKRSKGTLSGPEWAWTSWTERVEHDDSALTFAAEITKEGLSTRSEIAAKDRHTMGTPAIYPRFACEEFDARAAAIRKKR